MVGNQEEPEVSGDLRLSLMARLRVVPRVGLSSMRGRSAKRPHS